MIRINTGIFLNENVAQLTRDFKPYLYLGNPRNSIEIFSSMNFDELCVFSSQNNLDEKQIKYLKWIAGGSKSPLMYSGGVKSLDNARNLIENGYEKIGLQSQFFSTPELAVQIANCIGKQSSVLVLDCYYNTTRNIWEHKNQFELEDFLRKNSDIISNSFGEILFNSVTHNGNFNFSNDAIIALKNCANLLNGINIGYCGGISSVSDIQVLKDLSFDACYIFSAVTLSHQHKSKLLNSYVLRNI